MYVPTDETAAEFAAAQQIPGRRVFQGTVELTATEIDDAFEADLAAFTIEQDCGA